MTQRRITNGEKTQFESNWKLWNVNPIGRPTKKEISHIIVIDCLTFILSSEETEVLSKNAKTNKNWCPMPTHIEKILQTIIEEARVNGIIMWFNSSYTISGKSYCKNWNNKKTGQMMVLFMIFIIVIDWHYLLFISCKWF